VPVSNATVKALLFGNPSYFVYAITNTNGSYIIYVPDSNYSVNASASGYIPNESMPFNLTSNVTVNLTLVPVNWNTNLWTNELIPGLTVNQVKSSLTSSGNYTTSSFYNLSIQAINSTSGSTINNTQFLIIYRISGFYYYKILYSNATGLIDMGSMEGGNYAFFVVSVNYSQVVLAFNLNASIVKTAQFDHRQMYLSHIVLSDSFNSSAQNRSVPASGLVITNSSLLIPIQASLQFYGTNFTFDGWNGTFNFSYINVHFIPLNKSMTISGASYTSASNVTPYAIDLIFDTQVAWFFSLDNASPSTETPGSGNIVMFALAGTNTLLINVSGSTHMYSKTSDLTVSSPLAKMFLNVSRSNETVNTTGFQESGSQANYTFTLKLPLGSLVIGGNMSLNLSSSEIFLNGFLQKFSFTTQIIGGRTYSTFTLDPFFFGSGNVSMELITPKPPNNYIMSQFNLYYYKVTLT
jgi:hypothetical protein